jgi:hypothetical protein
MQTCPVSVADRDQVLAFRLDSHNLATRLPPSPTPRALLATPMGASNLDAIINKA